MCNATLAIEAATVISREKWHAAESKGWEFSHTNFPLRLRLTSGLTSVPHVCPKWFEAINERHFENLSEPSMTLRVLNISLNVGGGGNIGNVLNPHHYQKKPKQLWLLFFSLYYHKAIYKTKRGKTLQLYYSWIVKKQFQTGKYNIRDC